MHRSSRCRRRLVLHAHQWTARLRPIFCWRFLLFLVHGSRNTASVLFQNRSCYRTHGVSRRVLASFFSWHLPSLPRTVGCQSIVDPVQLDPSSLQTRFSAPHAPVCLRKLARASVLFLFQLISTHSQLIRAVRIDYCVSLVAPRITSSRLRLLIFILSVSRRNFDYLFALFDIEARISDEMPRYRIEQRKERQKYNQRPD